MMLTLFWTAGMISIRQHYSNTKLLALRSGKYFIDASDGNNPLLAMLEEKNKIVFQKVCPMSHENMAFLLVCAVQNVLYYKRFFLSVIDETLKVKPDKSFWKIFFFAQKKDRFSYFLIFDK